MKYKVLCWQRDDRSNFGIVYIYPESEYKRAEEDFDILNNFGGNEKEYYLIEIENRY